MANWYDRKIKEIEGEILEIQEKFPEISDELVQKTLLECASSTFDYRILGPILAKLMSKVEEKKFEYLEFEVHCEKSEFYNILAIMKNDFSLSTDCSKYDDSPSYTFNGCWEKFVDETAEILLLSKKWNIYDWQYFINFYIPKTWLDDFKQGNRIYSGKVDRFGKNYYYLCEFIRGVIGYRKNLSGKELTFEELNELMEEYYEKYNPTPFKEKDIVLGRRKVPAN